MRRENLDTIEALQQELDNLQKEGRDLKEKLRNTAKKAIIDNLVNRRDNSDFLGSSLSDPNRSMMMNNQSSDTYTLVHEINLMRNVNRLLQKNIIETNKHYAKSLCEKFQELPSIDQRRILKAEEASLSSLHKQSNDLMGDLLNSLGNFKVENLRNKGKSNENKKNNISLLMVGGCYSLFEFYILSLNQ